MHEFVLDALPYQIIECMQLWFKMVHQ